MRDDPHHQVLEQMSTSSSLWQRLRRHLSIERPQSRRLQRGQVLPIFAVMAVVILGGAALLTDAAWWWVNQQRMERAADAGALAGAIYLPGDRPTAFAKARVEAAKNGYVDGSGGMIVSPRVDPTDPRRLIVDIDGPVTTNFAKVFNMNSVDASAAGAATYVLPVPMGSPQSYYGVGFYQGIIPGVPVVDTTTESSGPRSPSSAPSGGQWAFSAGNITSAVASNDSAYAYETTNNEQQRWGGFGLATTLSGSPIVNPSADQSVAIRGFQVVLSDVRLSVACSNSKVNVQVSWDGGTSWSSTIATPSLGTSQTQYTLPNSGGDTSTAAWGGHSWVRGDFTDGNFQVRLVAAKGCSTSGVQFRVDQIQVNVHYGLTTTTTPPPTYEVLPVPDPATGSPLASQGFWGAIFTSGGVRENGDRYAPLYIGGANPPDGTNGGPNPDYDPNGYEYTIEVGSNGQVQLFDPVFCAVGGNLTGAWLGTGDHWTTDGTGGGNTIGPVSVQFKLFNTNGTPYTSTDDTQVGSTWSHDPGSETWGDFGDTFSRDGSRPQNYGRGDAHDCQNEPAHNNWVLPSGWSGLSAGTYRLNVNTNLGQNANHGAENLFAIWTKGTGRARVYGGGRMAAYTNLDDTGIGGAQKFYFSQIDAAHAGKTMVITLFDPGEANSDSYLRFLTPQGGTYNYAHFDWYSNDGRSGTNVTQVQTAAPAKFNNRVLTIQIVLPSNYGVGGLDPDGLGENGWWKVEYDVRAGNDTTTWEVRLTGNPVHLVME